MRSYVDNRWLFQKDAQVTKMRAYVEALPDEWEWTWLVPGNEGLDIDFAEGLPKRGISLYPLPWMDNVLQGRYFFPMREVFRFLENGERFDVMLLEVPELARPMRVAQQWTEVRFPIISMVEHVDLYDQTRVPELVRYMLRQIDGSLASDALAFPLEGMKQEWLKAAAATVAVDPSPPCGMPVWNAIYDPRDSKVFGTDSKRYSRKRKLPVINFISRLSDNQRTHYEEFFQACRLLWGDGERFEVWVQNPNEAQEESWIRAQGPFVTEVGNDGREDYLRSLWMSDIVPILYPQSHIYSLGYCEAITAGNHVITHAFEEHLVASTISLWQVDPETIKEALQGMMQALRSERYPSVSVLQDQAKWLIENRSVQANIGRVRDTIEEVASAGSREDAA